MARRKNAPDLVRIKCGVADRLRALRTELFGERGGPELARKLGLPVRTWYNYEGGVTVPGEVILRLIELTRVEAIWLLHGTGTKFRGGDGAGVDALAPSVSIEFLLRTALDRLERGEADRRRIPVPLPDDMVLVKVDGDGPASPQGDSGPSAIAAMSEWQEACLDQRCLLVSDDAMAPLVAPGAYVAYVTEELPPEALDTRLVVAWLDGEPPIVRRFHRSGHLAVLRAENPDCDAETRLVDLDELGDVHRVRAVSWITTPR